MPAAKRRHPSNQIPKPEIQPRPRMEWANLLTVARIGHTTNAPHAAVESQRSHFQRDWDRIVFSNAFRRMHDKTQVFPLPEDDVVHSRLTHSLEASSVGRSLGHEIGRTVCARDARLTASPDDFGAIVATACLAHDIGNPPFGHAGEEAISEFFKARPNLTSKLTHLERMDFELFEGNAQGFRIITRLQLETDGGMFLTAPTLGAFTRYPRCSDPALKNQEKSSTKKHGFFQADKGTFDRLATAVELLPIRNASGFRYARHPLAFLVEAADDICYSLLDIEDAVRLKLVPFPEAEEALGSIASKSPSYDGSRAKRFTQIRERYGYLRALAIGQLIRECSALFLAHERDILSGSWDSPLAANITSSSALSHLNKLAREKCYVAPSVLEIELAGHQAISGLLEVFTEAAIGSTHSKRTLKAKTLLEQSVALHSEVGHYARLLRVTDYVCGMTDRYALSLWRRLTGISIPGRLN